MQSRVMLTLDKTKGSSKLVLQLNLKKEYNVHTSSSPCLLNVSKKCWALIDVENCEPRVLTALVSRANFLQT